MFWSTYFTVEIASNLSTVEQVAISCSFSLKCCSSSYKNEDLEWQNWGRSHEHRVLFLSKKTRYQVPYFLSYWFTTELERSTPKMECLKNTVLEQQKRVPTKHGYGSIPISTIFSGMNIHLPAILMFTRGPRVLTHCHISTISRPIKKNNSRCKL
jgi:hypothetical protein